MCRNNCLFVTASLLLTLTFIAVGIAFFGPFWLSNLGSPGARNETYYTEPQHEPYLPYNRTVWQHPDRGLWAQCGHTCSWFWTDEFRLQSRLFTPLSECCVCAVRRNEQNSVVRVVISNSRVSIEAPRSAEHHAHAPSSEGNVSGVQRCEFCALFHRHIVLRCRSVRV